ncbi:hypothetical protein L7F22_058405 [Adiantum nelumboides]|nr:hypothetical protein [Adiantum nelumboides]
MVDVATYGLQVISKAKEDDAKVYGELWPYALKTAERDKVSRQKLCEARNCICETTRWSDPVDSLLVYAYITKSEANEAWVEEKRKRDEKTARSSKIATKSSNKKEEVLKPTPEVNMEDAPQDKKQELQAHQGAEWQDFKKALKEEYFLENSERVTKQRFMKWIKQRNKGLSACEMLRELEKMYDQLSASEQRSIRSEQVELFAQAANARLQKSLLNVVIKRLRVDKLIVVDSSKTSDEEVKEKLATLKHKLDEPVLDDLVKDIQELNLNLKTIKLESLNSKGSTSDFKPRPPCKVVCGEPIRVNFGQGGMKKLAEEILHNVTMVLAATYDLQVISKAKEDVLKVYGELWPYALKMAERVYAYIAKSKANEAWVEEKRKRDEETTGSSKTATRSSNKKEEVPKPTPEVNMEDALKDKKQDDDEEAIPRIHFTRTHWARAMTETIVKLGEMDEPVLALVDHASKFNLMSKSLHPKGRWPIDVDHGWRIQAANMPPGHLYGASANVKVATLIVAMFVRDLDGPLPVPFYDCWAGDIIADIDGYEADSDML